VAIGRISRFPVDLRRRPYLQHSRTTVRVCDFENMQKSKGSRSKIVKNRVLSG